MLEINKIHQGDCLELMKQIDDKSVNMILCDLPYGTTACKWDTVIPFDKLWVQYNRIIKDNGAIVLTASQPFTSALVMSNSKMFRHEWIYKKRCASNFAQAKYAPMKEHESVLVFSKNKTNYYPIKEERQGSGKDRVKYLFSEKTRHKSGEFISEMKGKFEEKADNLRYPSSVQEFNNRANGDRGLHPTQKPLKLGRYLIKTYSKEGDIVLDNACGCGSFLLSAKLENRNFIGIELDKNYYNIAVERIEQEKSKCLENNIWDCNCDDCSKEVMKIADKALSAYNRG